MNKTMVIGWACCASLAGCSDTDGAIRGELKSDRVPVIRAIEVQQPRVQVDTQAPAEEASLEATLAVRPGAEVKSRTYLRLERARLVIGDWEDKEPDEDEPAPLGADVSLVYESQSSRLVQEDILAFSSDPFSDALAGKGNSNDQLAELCAQEETEATLYVYFDAYYAKNEGDDTKIEPYVIKSLVSLECTPES